jgi:hypothetical protein
MGIYEECCRILWLEIDYLHEGRNVDNFDIAILATATGYRRCRGFIGGVRYFHES